MTPIQLSLRNALQPSLQALASYNADPLDIEDLEDAIAVHLDHTRVLSAPAAGFRHVGMVVAPIYASETLAQFIRFADTISPAGLGLLHVEAVQDTGSVILDSAKRSRELVIKVDRPIDDLCAMWRKQGGVLSGLASASPLSLEALPVPKSAVKIAEAYLDGLKPVVQFALKSTLKEKDLSAQVRAFVNAARPGVEKVMAGVLGNLRVQLLPAIDTTALEQAKQSPLPHLGYYNFLTAPPAAGADPEKFQRYRQQASQAYRNLTGLLSRFTHFPSFEDRLRQAIDVGESVHETISNALRVPASHVKAFFQAKLTLTPELAPRIDGSWIQNYSAILNDLPSHLAPKSEEDIELAQHLVGAAGDIRVLSQFTGTSVQEYWQGTLKEGWLPSVLKLSRLQHAAPIEDPVGNARRAHTTIIECAGMAHTLLSFIESEAHPHERFAGVEQFNSHEFVGVLLRGKTIRRLGEFLREYRTAQREAVDAELQVPDAKRDVQPFWTPLLEGAESIQIGDFTVRELVNSQQLRAEGSYMSHCVAGYTDHCMRNGSRIFAIERNGADARDVTSRATLEVRIVDDARLRVNQYYAYDDQHPRGPAVEVRDQFLAMIESGEIRCRFDGFRQDRLRNFQQTDFKTIAAQARLAVLDRQLAFLLPKNHRNLTLSEYVRTPSFSEELRVFRAARAPEPEAAPSLA